MWPEGWWTQTYAAATIAVVVFALWRGRGLSRPIALVIWGNWLLTRLIDVQLSGPEKFLCLGVADFLSIIALVLVGVSLSTLTCAAMLACCIGLYCLHLVGAIFEETMWTLAEPLGYAMLLTLIGESLDVGGRMARAGYTARTVHGRLPTALAARLSARASSRVPQDGD